MKDNILQLFDTCTSKINVAANLIVGLIEQRRVSSTLLAKYQEGNALLESKCRKIDRFFQQPMDTDQLLTTCAKLIGKQKFILSIDRTNWKFGNTHINAFVAVAHTKDGVGYTVALDMLDNKGGNSDTDARIALIKSALMNCNIKQMQAM